MARQEPHAKSGPVIVPEEHRDRFCQSNDRSGLRCPTHLRGSYTGNQTTMQVVDRDAEKMARIWRIVKGFPQLAARRDKMVAGRLIVPELATKIGETWPNCEGLGSNDKGPRDAWPFL
ncbi:MAG: hypothetical protein U0934_08950 [Pseudotabrizicola sp.]|uniref:hypothetical protein n=1 Tax=Pseudotabrizicola sp. TaxID=2939647 RepID=UPI0027312268|nr:hypothetical protein [Pseudotabrizicola sp.]MDZ7574071.1 hypothetical protein [Pseudotabrizicola sp.]